MVLLLPGYCQLHQPRWHLVVGWYHGANESSLVSCSDCLQSATNEWQKRLESVCTQYDYACTHVICQFVKLNLLFKTLHFTTALLDKVFIPDQPLQVWYNVHYKHLAGVRLNVVL